MFASDFDIEKLGLEILGVFFEGIDSLPFIPRLSDSESESEDGTFNLSGILVFALFISITLVVLDPLQLGESRDTRGFFWLFRRGRW